MHQMSKYDNADILSKQVFIEGDPVCVGWTCRVWAAVGSPGVEYWVWRSSGREITACVSLTNRYDGHAKADAMQRVEGFDLVFIIYSLNN